MLIIRPPTRFERASVLASTRKAPLDSKKLLSSKWTAVEPHDREKHFFVRRVLKRRAEEPRTGYVELEAVISKRVRRLSLRELSDTTRWTRGWSRDSDSD
jgi:tryptophan-rich hypothetical protein